MHPSSSKRCIAFSAVLGWLLLLLGSHLPAQPADIELFGTILDKSGSRVPQARVILIEERTGWARDTSSGSTGEYRFMGLRPGSFTVRAESEGFETLLISGLRLTFGERARVDIQLTVSPLHSEVTIESDGSTLERERAAQTTAVDSLQLDTLPIDGRGYLDFSLLTPGVSDRYTLSSERPVQAPTSGLSFSGQDQRSNAIRIDGMDNLDDISNSPRSTLSQEAIQEFQVSRGVFPAALGGARAGVIDVVTRSGGNEFHGSAFGFFRDEALDARNAFDRSPAGSKAAFERRQFGGSLGGPVRSDRTFFFASYEGQLRDESQFVSFLDAPGIFEPTTSQQELFGFLGEEGNPFEQSLSALFVGPEAGLLRTLPTTFPGTLRLLERESGAFPFNSDRHAVLGRLDHQLSPANQLFGRFNFTDSQSDNTDFGALEGVSNGVSYDVRDTSVVVGDLHAFSPVTLNDFRFQYAHRNLAVLTNDPLGPEITIAGVAEFGREFLNPTRYRADLYELQDQISWIRGQHSFSAGIDMELRRRRGDAEVFLGGQFVFGEAIPLGAVLDSALGSGASAMLALRLATPTADGGLGRPDLAAHLAAPITALQAFNFGLPLSYFQGFGDPSTDVPVDRLGAFFQDSWRVADGFTLTLGVRYDTAWRTSTLNLASSSAPFAFDRGSVNDHDNLAPRLGFAWRPWGGDRLTVRGGYGIYYQNIPGALDVTSSVLSGQISQVFLPLTGLPGIDATSADIWKYQQMTGLTGAPVLEHFGISPGTTPSVIIPGDPGLQNPLSHQAGLGLARAFGRDWALEVDYLMNHGVHLIRSRDVNVRPVGDGRFGIPGQDPRFVQIPIMETSGSSTYHGLTAGLRKRFSSGHAFSLAYTLGKAIDDTTDFIIELGPRDHTNLRAERSLSTFDQRHRLVFSGIFQTPGQVSAHRRFVDALFRNWTLAPIVTWSTGKPFNLLNGFDRNGDTHEESDRPLTVAGQTVGRNTGRGPGYFSTDLRLTRRIGLPWEDARLELSFEAFNLFNHLNYRMVNNVVGDRVLDTGDVSGSAEIPANRPLGFTSAFEPRRIQIGLRLAF